MDKKTLTIVGLLLGTYILSSGISYALFSQTSLGKNLTQEVKEPEKKSDGTIAFDPELPKTEACPLNGAKYSKQQRDWWEKHRPLGVMIENHESSRPQSGLSFADVIYEAVAEGGITRFLTVFYCQDTSHVGPVRSARTYFLDFISEYGENPLYAHVGGANTPGPADAISQITNYDWTGYNDLNQFSIGYPTFVRDYDRLGHPTDTEHTMYSSPNKLWTFAAKSRKLTDKDEDGNKWDAEFVPYKFKDDSSESSRPKSQSIHLEFWDGQPAYEVNWGYDPKSNNYSRSHGKDAHVDRNTNKVLTAKNIAVLIMQESRANDGYEGNLHLLYKTKGSGKAFIFRDGKQTTGTWKKSGRTDRLRLFDNSGDEIEFNRGAIWFEVLPTDGVVTVK